MINPDTLSALGPTAAAVIISLAALWYIDRMSSLFNSTIQNYMKESNHVNRELSLQMERFTEAQKESTKIIKEHVDINEKLYMRLRDMTRKERKIINS